MIDSHRLESVNNAIQKGTALQRNGEPVAEPIEAGLLRTDGKFLYVIRDRIPVMLIDESIDMSTIA